MLLAPMERSNWQFRVVQLACKCEMSRTGGHNDLIFGMDKEPGFFRQGRDRWNKWVPIEVLTLGNLGRQHSPNTYSLVSIYSAMSSPPSPHKFALALPTDAVYHPYLYSLRRVWHDYYLVIGLVNHLKLLCGWCWFAWFFMHHYSCLCWWFYWGSTSHWFLPPSQ